MMKKSVIVLLTLIAIFVISGCSSVDTTTAHKQFKDIHRYIKDGKVCIVMGPSSQQMAKKVDSTVQGELSLKIWLFSNIDEYRVYIKDKNGQEIEYYTQLRRGEPYTLIDEEYKFGQLVMKSEMPFVFSKKYDGKAFSIGLEIQPFNMDFNFTIEDSNVSFNWTIGEEYEFNVEESNYEVDLSYSNVFHYLTKGELKYYSTGNIGGISWDLGRFKYQRLLDGVSLGYDSLIEDDKNFEFSFIVPGNQDIRLRLTESFDLGFVDVTIDGGEQYKKGTIIKGGSIIYVSFKNSPLLDCIIKAIPVVYIIDEKREINEKNFKESFFFSELPFGEYILSVEGEKNSAGIQFDTLTFVNGQKYDDTTDVEELYFGESIKFFHFGGELSIEVESYLMHYGINNSVSGVFKIKLEEIETSLE